MPCLILVTRGASGLEVLPKDHRFFFLRKILFLIILKSGSFLTMCCPIFFFLHHTSNPMIGGKSVSSGKEDSYGKGLDVASSWHSCIDPSGLRSDQHWESTTSLPVG